MTDRPIFPSSRASRSPARAALDEIIRRNAGAALGPYLRRVARASVAAAIIGGCSTSHVGDEDAGSLATDASGQDDAANPIDAGLPDARTPSGPSDLCHDGMWLAVDGLDLPSRPDYLAAVQPPRLGGLPYLVHHVGERCGRASDEAACDEELNRLERETYEEALLTSDGDLVRARTTEEEFAAFLGPVNTPHEAALMAWQAGFQIYCSGDHLSSVTEIDGGWRVIGYTVSGGCGEPYVTLRYTIIVSPEGTVSVEDSTVVSEEDGTLCIGRRPAGLRPVQREDRGEVSSVGAFFAEVARLERSAVVAFDVMVDELLVLGAPAALVDAARAAGDDEIRHTAAMSAVAERYGSRPAPTEVDPIGPRGRFEIALENAVEGCVRETYGALVGAHQALRASDPVIAAAMREVSEDEIRHAELSWALAGWLEPQLSGAERAQIEQAKRDAVAALRAEAARPVDLALVEVAGLPDPDTARGMVERLAADLWG